MQDKPKEQDIKQTQLGAMPIIDYATRLLGKRRNKVPARGKGFADLPVAERHKLRIALKKLRYAVEFFSSLFDKHVVKPFLGSMKALQDDLGHLKDVAVAETLLDDLLTSTGKLDIGRSAGIVIGWHARGVADLEPALTLRWPTFDERRAFGNDGIVRPTQASSRVKGPADNTDCTSIGFGWCSEVLSEAKTLGT